MTSLQFALILLGIGLTVFGLLRAVEFSTGRQMGPIWRRPRVRARVAAAPREGSHATRVNCGNCSTPARLFIIERRAPEGGVSVCPACGQAYRFGALKHLLLEPLGFKLVPRAQRRQPPRTPDYMPPENAA